MTSKPLSGAISVSDRLHDKFRGCLIGSLVGDCLGDRFEYNKATNIEIRQHIDLTENKIGAHIHLTDDTQMSEETADSLLINNGFDPHDLARRYVERYYKDKNNCGRLGYGAGVKEVFQKLKVSNYADPFQPAREQFNGGGSLGNGAAMRVAPVSLFAISDIQRTAQLAEETASITHTNKLGKQGAVFQAIAVRRSLIGNYEDPFEFLKDFKSDLMEVNLCKEYWKALNIVEKFLVKKPEKSQVFNTLGAGVKALRSVPTALFCFLLAFDEIPGISSKNAFRRTIEYAISLGGDTDTIAAMAGALAGARLGLSSINENTWQACPDHRRILKQADDLYALTQENNLKG